MANLLSVAALAGVFGAASWAGYALTAPPGEEPAPAARPAEPAAAAPLGELDAGAAPARRKPAASKEGPLRLTFNDLSQWDLDPKNVQFPASILALSGKDVDLVGYMIPYGDPESVTEFALVKDFGSCCFGLAPQPHHVVECRTEKSKPVAWVPGPVRVRGRFEVGERRQGQILYSVYALEVRDCVEVR